MMPCGCGCDGVWLVSVSSCFNCMTFKCWIKSKWLVTDEKVYQKNKPSCKKISLNYWFRFHRWPTWLRAINAIHIVSIWESWWWNSILESFHVTETSLAWLSQLETFVWLQAGWSVARLNNGWWNERITVGFCLHNPNTKSWENSFIHVVGYYYNCFLSQAQKNMLTGQMMYTYHMHTYQIRSTDCSTAAVMNESWCHLWVWESGESMGMVIKYWNIQIKLWPWYC